MNGIVFRLGESDFPCIAGSCFDTHFREPHTEIKSLGELTALLGIQTSRAIPDTQPLFEIILLNKIPAKRFIKTLKDRDTSSANRRRLTAPELLEQ